MSDYTLRIDRQELANQLAGPGGILTRQVARLERRIVNNAAQRAPVDTGNLRRMIAADPIVQTGFNVTGSVTSRANYSAFVHNGTDPHIIRPRNARALRFTSGGQVVFARYVNHPGTRARPFLWNAAAEEVSRLTG